MPRKSKARFAGIPFSVIRTEQYATLTGPEVKLLVDLLYQFNGRNNGTLSPTITLLEKHGWSSTSLWRAKAGLLKKGFIVVTRQGWKQRGKPTLVAVTWHGIDETNIEYDVGVKPSSTPLNLWCKPPEKPVKPKLRVITNAA